MMNRLLVHVEGPTEQRFVKDLLGRKAVDGVYAARAITLERMRDECRHFADWLDRLEAAGRANP